MLFDICGIEKTLFLSDVLTEMKKVDARKNPVPFSLKIRSFNLQNKTGGKLISYEDAVLLRPPAKKGAVRLADETPFKNPNHWENRTRNIKLKNGEIKKIHIIFIEEFNGKKVIF